MTKRINTFYDEEGKGVNITCYHGRIAGKIINSVVDKDKVSELTEKRDRS